PWLPYGENLGHRSVEMQRGDPRSMLELYRTLLALRRSRPALHRGSYEPHACSDETLWVYARGHAGDRIVVALNFGDVARALPTSLAQASVVAATSRDILVAGALRPRSAVLLA